ncbi:hypothetical protein D3C80_1657480 [compost metagenome]
MTLIAASPAPLNLAAPVASPLSEMVRSVASARAVAASPWLMASCTTAKVAVTVLGSCRICTLAVLLTWISRRIT